MEVKIFNSAEDLAPLKRFILACAILSGGQGFARSAEVVTLDFSRTSPVSTLFGSNAQVNDNQKVRNRLFDERILDRGFEWTADLKWTPQVGGGAVATITQDCTQRYADRCSVKADIASFPGGSYVQAVQIGVWVEAGKTYTLSFWAKSSGYGGNVTARLIDPLAFSPIVASPMVVPAVATGWTRYTGSWTATQSEENALLLLQFNAVGSVWIDELSLTPATTQSGLSPGLYSALGELGLKTVRFGSGSEANAYDWKKAVGPRDQRRVNVSVMHYYTANAGAGIDKKPYYNDFGIDEFLRLAEVQGWTPVFIVNLASGPTVAAQWVEYCNGSPASTYGAQRAANGHREPYGVKYWEVGNEIWNQESPEPGAIPNPGSFTQANTDNYIAKVRAFSDAMKAVDATIRVGAVGGHKPSDSYMTGRVDPNWNEDLLAGAADKVDFIALHIYAPFHDSGSPTETAIYNSLMGSPLYFEEEIQTLQTQIAARNPQIKIAVTEFSAAGVNTTGDNLYFAQNLQSTLYMASMKNLFLRRNVALAHQFDLLNEFSSLLDHTVTAGHNATFVRHGPFLLETLYKDFLKPMRVDTVVSGSTFASTPVGWMRAEPAIPVIDAIASLDSSGNKISVILVNRKKDAAASVELKFDHFITTVTFDTGSVISAPTIGSRNTVTSPSEIVRTPFTASDAVALPSSAQGEPRFQVTLRKASVTALQFSIAPDSIPDVNVYPNPYRPSITPQGMTFAPLAEGDRVRILTMGGSLVEELTADSTGKAVWHGRNAAGQLVASGVYLALVQNAKGQSVVKFVVQE